MNNLQDIKQVTKDLTIKERKFWDLYFVYGNGTKAALEVYDTDSPATAASIASENLRKHKGLRNAYMEMKGISLGKLVDKINEGLEATKTTNAAILLQENGETIKAEEQGLIEVKDFATRHKYVETAAKWLDIQKPDILIHEGSENNNQFNFFGLTYEQITAFTDKTGTNSLREDEFTDVFLKGSIRSEQQEPVMELHTDQVQSEDTESEDMQESSTSI